MEQTSLVEQTVSSLHEQKVKIVEQTPSVRAEQFVEHVRIVYEQKNV